jgi:hypothetical protein
MAASSIRKSVVEAMNSFWIALAITSLLYGIPASIRTGKRKLQTE